MRMEVPSPGFRIYIALWKYANLSLSRTCIKLFDDEKVNWRRAKALCVANGAKLVEVNSPKENDFLKALQSVKGIVLLLEGMNIEHFKKRIKFISDHNASYWTGGNDLATRNRWVWTSRGHLVNPYVNWLVLPSIQGDQGAGRWDAVKVLNLLWSQWRIPYILCFYLRRSQQVNGW